MWMQKMCINGKNEEWINKEEEESKYQQKIFCFPLKVKSCCSGEKEWHTKI
jgi:hypothetical protein